MTFKEEALRKLFVFIKDTNTNKIKRTVVPAELQVGLYDNPTSLDIFGRLAINSVEYTVNKQNDSGIIRLKNHDTLTSIITELIPTSEHIDVYLPATPRNGQIHFVKDGSATAAVTPINIYPSSTDQTIDGQNSVTLDTNYGSLAIAWVQNEWRQIVAGANSTSGAPTNATYVTINNESSLSNERALAGSSNVTITDNGAGSDVEIDLTDSGVTAGVYSVPFIAVDAKGRITAAANGAGAFAPASAEYLVLSADGTLSDERIFSASTGLVFVDNGAGSSFVVSIDDSVVATLSGSIFSGPVVAQGGLSGSLQNLSDGTSYLVAGANVTITSGSSGQVIISAATSASIGNGADEEATYLVVSLTSSLPNERAVSSSFGLRITDGGAGSTFDFAVSDDEIATLTGSIFRGDVKFNAGLSGSLQNLVDGSSYLVAGANVTITTQSNGQVEIAASGGGGGSGDTDATYIVISNTSSLNAERQLEVGTGLILSDSGANSSVTISADDNVLATLSGSLFSGPVQADGGLSGSLQNLVSGESYLVAGSNITITTESNGQVTISSTASGGGGGDTDASYVVLSSTSSLSSERVLTAGDGISITDNGADNTVVISNDTAFTGTYLTYSTASYHDLTHDPVVLYQFSGSLVDTSGNSLNLSLGAGTARYTEMAPGILGAQLDGSSYFVRSITDTLLLITGSMTVEAIISMPEATTGDVFFVAMSAPGESLATNILYQFASIFSSPVMQWRYFGEYAGGTNVSYQQTSPTSPVGRTMHVAMTRADTTNIISFYVDGDYVGSSTSLTTTAFSSATQTFAVGYDNAGSNISRAFNIASLKIISGSALSASEVRDEYNRTLGQLYKTISRAVSDADWTDGANQLKTTSSVSISSNDEYVSSQGEDVYFFVSGSIGASTGSGSPNANITLFGGDVRISGSLTVGSGSVTITSNDIRFGDFTTRIEKQGGDLKFFDANNTSGKSLSDIGSGGGGSTTGWETAYEIDFTTLSAVTASTSTVSIDGYTWNVENLANADFIGVIPGTGLQVDPNANSTDYYTNVRTSPLIWISIQSLVPDYDPTIDDLRVFVNLELTGSDANFEIASTALTKLPYPGNTTQFSHQFFRGYSGGSFTSSRSFLGSTLYSGINGASSSSAGMMVLSHNYTNFGVYGLDYDYATYSFPTGSVKQNLGNFNLRGSTAGYQTIRFEYEPEIAFEFAAFPVNTANSFQATIRHLLIQRKR